jgi:hypothetical protein
MSDELDEYIKKAATGAGVKDKILSAARRAKTYGYEIPDDVADDFYNLTKLESGRAHYLADGRTVKTGVKTPDGDFAIGFSQVMGNTAKPYKSKGLDPYKEEDNIIIGLNEFYNGDKSDPIARRLAYVGGINSPALAEYRRTGRVSDSKLYSYLPNNKETYQSYVERSGGYAPIDAYIKNGKINPKVSGVDDYIKNIATLQTNAITSQNDQNTQLAAYQNYASNLPKTETPKPFDIWKAINPTFPQNPVPETLETLQAQTEVTRDENLPSAIATLFTQGERARKIEPGFFTAKTNDGTLLINEQKLRQYYRDNKLGIFSPLKAQKDLASGRIKMTDLIGGKAVEFENTSGGNTLISRDSDGNELAASKITDNPVLTPADTQNAEKQAELDSNRFGGKIETQSVEPTEKVAKERIDVSDKDYAEYANYQKANKQPVVSREEFNKLAQNFGKDVEVSAQVNYPKEAVLTPENSSIIPETAYKELPNVSGNNKVIRTKQDLLDSQAGSVGVDLAQKPKGMRTIEYLFRSAFKALQPRFGYSDADIDNFIKNSPKISDDDKYWDKITDANVKQEAEDLIKQKGNSFVKVNLTRDGIAKLFGGSEFGVPQKIIDDYKNQQKELDDALAMNQALERGKMNPQFSTDSLQIGNSPMERTLRGQGETPILPTKTIDEGDGVSRTSVDEEELKRRATSDLTREATGFFGSDREPSEEEILKRIEDMKARGISPAFAHNIEDYSKNLKTNYGLFGTSFGGLLGGGARNIDWLNGIRKLASFGAAQNLLPETGIGNTMQQISNMGKIIEGETKFKDEKGKNEFSSDFVSMLGATPADLSRLGLQTMMPGGNIIAFPLDSMLQSVGRGDTSDDVFKETVKGGAMGLLFHGAGVLGESAKSGLLNSVLSKAEVAALENGTAPLSKKADALLYLYGRGATLGTITAGTTAIDLASGHNLDDSLVSGLQMGLFDVLTKSKEDAKNLAGKVFKVTDGEKTAAFTVVEKDNNLEIVELEKMPETADAVISTKKETLEGQKITDSTGKKGVVVKDEGGKSVVVEWEKGNTTQAFRRKLTIDESSNNLGEIKETDKSEILEQPPETPENKAPESLIAPEFKEKTEEKNKETEKSVKPVETSPETNLVSSTESLPDNKIDESAHEAATSPQNDLPEPTEAQREAGNYKMGHINVNGLDITVEIPVGGERKGVDRNGKEWSRTMGSHYGYIRRSLGADGENIDVFVKDGTPEDFNGQVYIVDQIHPDTGKFDEHKVLIGFDSEAEARQAYQSNYSKDWKGLKDITVMPFEEFKKWSREEEQTKPASEKPLNVRLDPELVKTAYRSSVRMALRKQGYELKVLGKNVIRVIKRPENTTEAEFLKALEKANVQEKSQSAGLQLPIEENIPEQKNITTESAQPKSKVGTSIEANAIENDLTKSFEGTAEYTPVTVKEQAEKAANLVNSDLEKARRIISGKEKLPNNLRAAPLISAVEKYAQKTGDAELLKELANSSLTAETSLHAQELRLLRERQPNSPVKLIQEIQKTREAATEKRVRKTVKDAVKKEVEKIQIEIKKTSPKFKDWREFVDKLECRV